MIFELSYKDNRTDNWVLYSDAESLSLRKEYQILQCSSCGKLDQKIALEKPIDAAFRVSSKFDWVGTNDDFICVSQRLKDCFNENNVEGVEFKELPGDSKFFLLMSSLFVETDEYKSGFKKVGSPCSKCGRYKEVIEGPLVEGMRIPGNKLAIFASEIENENIFGSYTPLFCSEDVVKIIKNNNLKGFEIIKAL